MHTIHVYLKGLQSRSVGSPCQTLRELHTLIDVAQRGLQYLVRKCVCLSVCPSVCYHVFCDYAQRDNKIAIPTGSLLHWLHF